MPRPISPSKMQKEYKSPSSTLPTKIAATDRPSIGPQPGLNRAPSLIGPQLPGNLSSSLKIGPSLPVHLQSKQKSLDEEGEEDSDDDDFGPSPLPASTSSSNITKNLAQDSTTELQSKMNAIEERVWRTEEAGLRKQEPGTPALEREEWMMAPGKQGLAALGLSGQMKSRTFLRAADVVDEEPKEESANYNSSAKRRNAEIRVQVDELTKKHRGDGSLMDRHSQGMLRQVMGVSSGYASGGDRGDEGEAKSDDPSSRSFNWERDMSLKKKVSLSERDQMVQEAKSLNSKFAPARFL